MLTHVIFQVVHIVFAWSSIISWILLTCDLLLIVWLTFCAYRDGKAHIALAQRIDLKGLC